MSDNLIRRAREALANVTPGPWVMETVRTSCGTCHRIGPFPRRAYASKPEGWACVYDDYPPGVGSPDLLANSRFIAAASDLVPAMADRLEAQEALLREAMCGLSVLLHVYDGVPMNPIEAERRATEARAILAKLREHLEDSHAK